MTEADSENTLKFDSVLAALFAMEEPLTYVRKLPLAIDAMNDPDSNAYVAMAINEKAHELCDIWNVALEMVKAEKEKVASIGARLERVEAKVARPSVKGTDADDIIKDALMDIESVAIAIKPVADLAFDIGEKKEPVRHNSVFAIGKMLDRLETDLRDAHHKIWALYHPHAEAMQAAAE